MRRPGRRRRSPASRRNGRRARGSARSYEPIVPPPQMRADARMRPVLGALDQPGAHRIEGDVARGGDEMILVEMRDARKTTRAIRIVWGHALREGIGKGGRVTVIRVGRVTVIRVTVILANAETSFNELALTPLIGAPVKLQKPEFAGMRK